VRKIKTLVFSLVPLMLLLLVLEITGRIIYPFDVDERAMIKAERDPRLELSYLAGDGDGKEILYDIHRKHSRYLPFLGWIGKANINLPTISTNTLGFRDAPLQPRAGNEYRILLLGGSTAWGLGASSNEATVTGALQEFLNTSNVETTFRVMSGAYPGWQSRQELVAIMEYYSQFDPDLVVALTGYNDLHVLALGGNPDLQMRAESQMLAGAVDATLKPMGTIQAIRKVAGSLGIWRIVVYFREMMQNNASGVSKVLAYDAGDSERILPGIADRYVTMSNFAARHGSRLLIAVQPDIYTTGKSFPPEEQQVLERFTGKYMHIGDVYSRYRNDALGYFSAITVTDSNASVTDLAAVFNDSDEPVFLDECHLNDKGYLMVAESLGRTINDLYLIP
jgi:lysophospholipase L1-like esterase